MPNIKQCEHCEADFDAGFPSRKRRFCSRACAALFAPTGGRKRTGIERPCEQCQTIHYVKQWQLKGGTGRFCSAKCQQAWQARNSVIVECAQCGKGFRCSPWWSKRRKYCSRACESAARITTAIDRQHNGRPVLRDSHGYLRVWDPGSIDTSYQGWVFEHRVVMEQILGRSLAGDETIHHVNGIKDDNRPENLVVLKRGEHTKITNAEKVKRNKREKAELAEYRKRFGPLESTGT